MDLDTKRKLEALADSWVKESTKKMQEKKGNSYFVETVVLTECALALLRIVDEKEVPSAEPA